MNLKRPFLCSVLTILLLGISTYCQNKYQGYSLTVEADNDGACPVRYLPSAGAGNAIDVFVPGTNQTMVATGLTACDGSTVSGGNRIITNGLGGWCFQGAEPMYEVRLRTGVSYLWYPLTKETGFFNVKDFRPVTRSSGMNPQYSFSEPADYTKTIKNAVAFIAARQ